MLANIFALQQVAYCIDKAYKFSMNSNFPPLYPQEAYTQQNNTFAFSDESKALDDASKSAPLAGLLSGALNLQNSPLLPLLQVKTRF